MQFKHEKHGDTKPWRKRFAWWPVDIYSEGDWYTVWWEHYVERRVYIVKERPTKFGFPITCGVWEPERKMIRKV